MRYTTAPNWFPGSEKQYFILRARGFEDALLRKLCNSSDVVFALVEAVRVSEKWPLERPSWFHGTQAQYEFLLIDASVPYRLLRAKKFTVKEIEHLVSFYRSVPNRRRADRATRRPRRYETLFDPTDEQEPLTMTEVLAATGSDN